MQHSVASKKLDNFEPDDVATSNRLNF